MPSPSPELVVKLAKVFGVFGFVVIIYLAYQINHPRTSK